MFDCYGYCDSNDIGHNCGHDAADHDDDKQAASDGTGESDGVFAVADDGCNVDDAM